MSIDDSVKIVLRLDVVCERKELREEDSQELEKSVGCLRLNCILLFAELGTIVKNKERLIKYWDTLLSE